MKLHLLSDTHLNLMRKISVFNNITLDGFFTSPEGDMSWAHDNTSDPEWNEYVAGNAKDGGCLLFGRITYEMMASWWPTEMARKADPVVADRMNAMQKIVCSHTLKNPTWQNTTVISGDLSDVIRAMKKQEGDDITILGSGSIIAPLTDAGLIDNYTFVVCPYIIGKGKTMFNDVKATTKLKLTSTRQFKNGRTILNYVR